MNGLSLKLAPAQAVLLDGAALPFISARFVVASPLDAARLAQACRQAAGCHEAFSAIFDPAMSGMAAGSQPRIRIEVRRTDENAGPDIAGSISPPAGACAADGPLLLVVLETGKMGVEHILVSACALVCDRISLAIYLRQALSCYEAPGSGSDDTSAAETLSYGDFLNWRQSLADEPDWPAGLRYWGDYQEEMDRDVARPGLPFLFPRQALHGDGPETPPHALTFAVRRHAIDARTLAAIRGGARQHGLTEDAFLHAAWYVLLARLSNEYRLSYAWLHDSRQDYDALQGSIGSFERIMPVLGDADPDDGCLDVVKKFDAVLAAHRAWQEQIDTGQTARALACGVGFSVVRLPEASGARAPAVGPDVCGHAAYPLDMMASVLAAADGHAWLELQAPRGPAYEAWMDTLAAQYCCVLECMARQTTRAIGDVDLEDKDTLQGRRLMGNAAVAPSGTIDAWISHWARQEPERIALRYGNVALSYAEIDARIECVAARLAAMGVGVGDRVALLVPRGPDLVVALMGVLRSAAAYVPLDHGWPVERITRILAQSQPKLLLVDEPESSSVPPVTDACPCLALSGLLADVDAPGTRQTAAAGDAAYVIFTSGSTGVPKGVVIEHGQIMNYVYAASIGLGLSRCQVYGWTATVAADLGNTALFSAFFHGRTLAIADAGESTSSMAFRRFLLEKQVDCLKIVPSHLEALLADDAQIPLGTVILGGEPIARGVLGKLRRIDANARIYNHYGPTETTIGVLFHAFASSPAVPEPGESSPLSQAMANCEAFLVNRRGALAASGELGELYVAGRQLARGYLGAVEGGFGDFPLGSGQRCYRTGDQGRYLPGGGIVLCGRLDWQVKIRGYRVEPEEIAAALREMPGVSQAVVLAAPATGGSSRLAAFVVADESAKDYLTGKFLRSELSLCLPDYMVPAMVECVDAFPRLPNGKVDQQQLLKRISAPAVRDGQPSAEQDDALGRLLLHVARGVLDSQNVAMDDDFFDCGGDSIAAIRYVAALGDLLEVEIMPAAIFTHPTFRALRDFLRDEIFEGRQDDAISLAHAALAERECLDRPL